MSTEYGEKIALALRAVCQLHADTSRFLVDFDNKCIRAGWNSVFGTVATSGISTTLSAEYWMAEGVYRYYVKAPVLDLVKGVLVPFFHFQQKSKEPLLLVAQIKYQVAAGSSIKTVCKAWDIWKLYYDRNDRQDLGNVIAVGPLDDDLIEWARVLAVPLYSIKRVEDAEQLMTQVAEGPEVPPNSC
jgi:hypothetical protein